MTVTAIPPLRQCAYCGGVAQDAAIRAFGECDHCEEEEHPGLTKIETSMKTQCDGTRHELVIEVNGIRRCECGTRWEKIA